MIGARVRASCGCGATCEAEAATMSLAQTMMDRWYESHQCVPTHIFGHSMEDIRAMIRHVDAREANGRGTQGIGRLFAVGRRAA